MMVMSWSLDIWCFIHNNTDATASSCSVSVVLHGAITDHLCNKMDLL